MEDLVRKLHEGNHSLVVANGDVCTFDGRGVTDLYVLLHEDPEFLKGAHIVDKVVGKGAAALMVKGGIERLYADIISVSALSLLQAYHIQTEFGTLVPYIKNRNGTGQCPLEKLCGKENSANKLFVIIQDFVTNTTR
ncbi:DUF1893 domain-containing protein [Bacteroides uniformis]|uniref:DUF1893 domain-containing protein n=1 Tax=Bacteroides uniformis TaxID=820 RepID=A0A6I0LT93_BACUN|nr:DUF1893 domain-containing protein [Bacteroides uniformis]KAB4253965.1 DUF1893 domain-containing protein [Bacteroides uniformis]KAB4254149.1 DUF1893 domain-containing protein [Bacteroides uniformis]KAB4257716.1 DUF1893 domain-containing protein [Bacteroides uniformis]KAB4260204.1 DUF1893 domain-containing protein [Bacteroides uniformis]